MNHVTIHAEADAPNIVIQAVEIIVTLDVLHVVIVVEVVQEPAGWDAEVRVLMAV